MLGTPSASHLTGSFSSSHLILNSTLRLVSMTRPPEARSEVNMRRPVRSIGMAALQRATTSAVRRRTWFRHYRFGEGTYMKSATDRDLGGTISAERRLLSGASRLLWVSAVRLGWIFCRHDLRRRRASGAAGAFAHPLRAAGVGSEEALRGVNLRPPLKRLVRFSCRPLSQRCLIEGSRNEPGPQTVVPDGAYQLFPILSASKGGESS